MTKKYSPINPSDKKHVRPPLISVDRVKAIKEGKTLINQYKGLLDYLKDK